MKNETLLREDFEMHVLEDTSPVKELKKKIQELEKQLQDAKVRESNLLQSDSNHNNVFEGELPVSSVTATGSRSKITVTGQSSSKSTTFLSAIKCQTEIDRLRARLDQIKVSDREKYENVQQEINHLCDRLSKIIVKTRVTMISQHQLIEITENFRRSIGSGSFGHVYQGTWNEKQVAVKEVKLLWRFSTATEISAFTERIQREVEALSAVQHPNVVQLLGLCAQSEPYGHNSDEAKLFAVSILTDYVNGGTLFDCLFGYHPKNTSRTVLDVDRIFLIARHLIEALHFLHSTSQPDHGEMVMIHRDVKSANVLLHRDEHGEVVRAVLADFDLACFHSADQTQQNEEEDSQLSGSTVLVGTPGYVDPLYFESKQVSPSQDIYAYGVVLYEMLWGERPETMLAQQVRQSTIEDCVLKTHTKMEEKVGVPPSPKLKNNKKLKESRSEFLRLLATVGKQCVSLENRPNADDVLKLLATAQL